MRVIYVGDAGNVQKRVRQHRRGNVEASALRKHVATAMGYEIQTTRRTSGSYRKRIALPNPKRGERAVSTYLSQGCWKTVACASKDEARDLQWALIDRLEPLLNRESRAWDRSRQPRYDDLAERLLKSVAQPADNLSDVTEGPGVYVLYRERTPAAHRQAMH
jgi:hypothetical protein